MTPQDFIQKWGAPDGVAGPAYALNEEQGAQSHFLDLFELLGVSKPGVLRIKSRAALAGYVLRRWSIDSSPDHRLDPASHHLWLRNPQTLYGVESAALAPGALARSTSGASA